MSWITANDVALCHEILVLEPQIFCRPEGCFRQILKAREILQEENGK